MPLDIDVDLQEPLQDLENGTTFHPQCTNAQTSFANADWPLCASDRQKVQIGNSYIDTLLLGGLKEEWLRQHFVPRKYDLEVLNVLLIIAMDHIADNFTSFQGFGSESELTVYPEEVLAIAAVGALFSQVNGSLKLANALFYDSMRMAITLVSIKSVSANNS